MKIVQREGETERERERNKRTGMFNLIIEMYAIDNNLYMNCTDTINRVCSMPLCDEPRRYRHEYI